MTNQNSYKELLPHLFRQEYAKMTAVLCRRFGLNHFEIAEDIASDTFLKASEHWAINSVPENPTAWLYTVAKNKTKDYFKHISVFENRISQNIKPEEAVWELDIDVSEQLITDSLLSMIFAVSNPANSSESQTCLTLQILCGFSVEEIANAFLTKVETIRKRLHRARTNLRNDNFQINNLNQADIKSRLTTVLRTLYLLFNKGYYSKNSNRQIRKDLCAESLRLTLLLTENPLTNTTQVNALLALMCYQSSRLDARTTENGDTILFEDQNRDLWDQSLIEKGNYYLVNATNGNEISKYHLEAGIAYWHAATTNKNKWEYILQLYNQLVLMEYSPITVLNRSFAFAKVHGSKKAITEMEKLDLIDDSYYRGLLGYLYADTDIEKSIYHYNRAIELTKSKVERKTLKREVERLKNKE